MPAVTIQQAFALALEHHQAGRLPQAEALYRQILQSVPQHADAWHYLGLIAYQTGQPEAAANWIRQAIQLEPGNPAAHCNLGNALCQGGQFDEAITSYGRALELQADFPEALNNLGNALQNRNRLDEARAAYRRALELKPDYADVHYNLGNTLLKAGQFDEAVAAYRRALALQPGEVKVYNNLGGALAEQGHLDEAIATYRQALRIRPDSAETENNLGNALKNQGRLEEATAAYRRAVQLKPNHAGMHSNLVYALQFDPAEEEHAVVVEQARWNRKFSEPVRPAIQPYGNDRNPARRLRVGYVSPEFWDHVTGRYLVPLFEHHDHRDFEVVCYAGVGKSDPLTERFRERADHWRNTVGMNDETLAATIRQDGIDILVDLTQHLAGNRLPVFARHPAPVQVSVAGYPESTGVEAIRYRMSDRYLEPKTPSDHWPARSEQVCLLDSFWCYDPCGIDLAVNDLPARESRRVTFGCLNNFCKVNEPLLRLWARVLEKIEDSRLVLLCPAGSHRPRILEIFGAAGVGASRIEFVEPRPRRAYFDLYHRIDIALDPFPYHGHTTSMDALWMGVPVVSLAGQRPISRASLSLLSHLGLEEWIAFSAEEYIGMAMRLAHDDSLLAEFRRTLRSRMEASLLMDAPRFARNFETAFRTMWRQWCAEQKS